MHKKVKRGNQVGKNYARVGYPLSIFPKKVAKIYKDHETTLFVQRNDRLTYVNICFEILTKFRGWNLCKCKILWGGGISLLQIGLGRLSKILNNRNESKKLDRELFFQFFKICEILLKIRLTRTRHGSDWSQFKSRKSSLKPWFDLNLQPILQTYVDNWHWSRLGVFRRQISLFLLF
jgi:hypothetical protein